MADTRRSLSALQTLLADNSSGDISAQDARDELISSHPEKLSQTGTFASEPSSAQLTGDLYLPSDSFYVERYSGSAWVPWGPIFPLTKPPATGTFTAVNASSSTIAASVGGIFVSLQNNTSSDAIHLWKKSAPATPWTLTVLVAPLWVASAAANHTIFIGVLFRQASDGKIILFNIEANHNSSALGSVGIDVMKWTDATTFSARYAGFPLSVQPNALVFLRIADNGTNRICSLSSDGVNFVAVHTVGRTDFLTADEIGFGGYGYQDAGAFTILSWKEA